MAASELTFLFRKTRVIDGTATTPFSADVGVAGDRIAFVGDAEGARAHEVIDCEGLALAPGFIDIHGHSDYLLLAAPHAESKVLQGVTTEVGGNCGGSPAPMVDAVRAEAEAELADFGMAVTWETLAEFLALLEAGGIGLNFACLVGYGNVRAAVMGYEQRPASQQEIRVMQAEVAAAMSAGAVGVSSGLIYPPQTSADAAEIGEVCRAAGAVGGFYATHLRDERGQLLDAVGEALEVGRRSGCAVQLAHHKVCGEANWGLVEHSLALLDFARQAGMDVAADQYPYTATSTGLYVLLPEWAQEGGAEAAGRRLLDADTRRRAAADFQGLPPEAWEQVRIAQVKADGNRWAEGLTVPQAARQLEMSEPEAVIELIVRERGHVSMVRFAMCEKDIERVMKHPAVMVGSDASARATAGPRARGKPHPRAFGTFPRVLGHYVRERKVIGLGEAIRKMTWLPARRLGLTDRGVLRRGAHADLVLFDPESIADRATYEDPIQPPQGIKGVWVNGRIVARDGALTGALPGRVLRGRGAGIASP
ncbi:MAG: D-aminoacylase [Armatimonadota bacterium]|nr:MAG: D-aminoacylase [Armatimonadota bacterium]